MGRPPGKTKTFPRVVEFLTAAVKEKGQKAVESETKLSQSMISRYLKGEGEPSQATLEKLAAYFGVSVAYLRGEETSEASKELGRILTDFIIKGIETPEHEITEKISAAYKEQNPWASDIDVKTNVSSLIDNRMSELMRMLTDAVDVFGADEIVEVKFLPNTDESNSGKNQS